MNTTEEGPYLTLVHRFNAGLVCTARCPNKPPESPQAFGFTYHRTRRPKRRHVNKYRQFMLGYSPDHGREMGEIDSRRDRHAR